MKLIKTGLTLLLLSSFYKEVKAQGTDDKNHYKGLFENRFDSLEKWSLHFQITDVWQTHQSYRAAYSGENSLNDTAENAMSVTTTLFLGRKLWKGAALFVNPEIAGGKGLSYATGLGGESNGDCFRVGNPAPALYMARGYFQQFIAIKKNKTEYSQSDLNQLADNIPASRISITLGKFSLADFFDDNAYSHDPRSEFMNWALMDNGAWDYAANTRGYTWGGVIELIEPSYSIRIASVLVGKLTNSQIMDLNIKKANGNNIEFEKKFKIKNHAGSLHLLGFANFSHAPNYNTAINQMQNGDSSLINVIRGHVAGVEYTGLKYGFGISFNQELTKSIGIFSRVGWNDGQTASWAFCEIDQTVNAGIRISADKIKRPNDNFGVACIVNGLSAPHRNYLNAGGYGFILGDGKLTNYGYEQILETFYKIKLSSWLWVTLDYQFTINPGYNKDRGPVSIYGFRTHVEF